MKQELEINCNEDPTHLLDLTFDMVLALHEIKTDVGQEVGGWRQTKLVLTTGRICMTCEAVPEGVQSDHASAARGAGKACYKWLGDENTGITQFHLQVEQTRDQYQAHFQRRNTDISFAFAVMCTAICTRCVRRTRLCRPPLE